MRTSKVERRRAPGGCQWGLPHQAEATLDDIEIEYRHLCCLQSGLTVPSYQDDKRNLVRRLLVDLNYSRVKKPDPEAPQEVGKHDKESTPAPTKKSDPRNKDAANSPVSTMSVCWSPQATTAPPFKFRKSSEMAMV